MSAPIFGVVADDLTGGLETAAMLVADGIDCAFTTDPAEVAGFGSAQAIVVAQKTRVIESAVAVDRQAAAARALLRLGARQLFFKYCATFDSTDQGNIGPVSDMLMALTGAPHTIFCPGAPDLLRTVYNGHLFLGTQLISESPKRHDPLTPMTDPDLVRVLRRQTALTVGLLAHPMISAGGADLDRAVADLAATGIRYLVADTIYDRDLDHIAKLTVDWKVMTGNATIVRHYPALWRHRGLVPAAPLRRALPAVGGKAVVLSGSCAERTLEQLAEFEKTHPVLRLDLTLIDDAEMAIGSALNWALTRLDAGPVAISTSSEPAAVAAAHARHGRAGAAALAESTLSGLARALHRSGVRRFVVAGGETSGAVVERLGIRVLEVGPYGGPGVGLAVTSGQDPVALCLKSGKLGPVDLFTRMLTNMRSPGTSA